MTQENLLKKALSDILIIAQGEDPDLSKIKRVAKLSITEANKCNSTHNLGWHRISGPDDLPKEKGKYTVLNESGEIETWEFTGHFRNKNIWLGYFTHWRPLVEMPRPIY